MSFGIINIAQNPIDITKSGRKGTDNYNLTHSKEHIMAGLAGQTCFLVIIRFGTLTDYLQFVVICFEIVCSYPKETRDSRRLKYLKVRLF